MANVFAGSEIVEMGIQIEKNGRDYYNTFAARSRNHKVKDIFKYLAGEEEKHIEIFQAILSTVEQYEPQEAYPGEYFAYMNALASEHVFTRENKGPEAANKVKSDREAVELGIGFEQESIIFYEGMKKAVPEKDHGIINKLIEQEQGHLVKLTDLKKSL